MPTTNTLAQHTPYYISNITVFWNKSFNYTHFKNVVLSLLCQQLSSHILHTHTHIHTHREIKLVFVAFHLHRIHHCLIVLLIYFRTIKLHFENRFGLHTHTHIIHTGGLITKSVVREIYYPCNGIVALFVDLNIARVNKIKYLNIRISKLLQ